MRSICVRLENNFETLGRKTKPVYFCVYTWRRLPLLRYTTDGKLKKKKKEEQFKRGLWNMFDCENGRRMK